MNRLELIKKVASENNIPVTKATKLVISVFDVITDAMASGESVIIKDFGSFNAKQTPARIGRNPKTKEAVGIPASAKISFLPSQKMLSTICDETNNKNND